MTFAEALGCRGAALRRDECGDWRIVGRLGHIYAVSEGFQIYFRGAEEFDEPTSSQGWTVGQESDGVRLGGQRRRRGGHAAFDRLPTEDERRRFATSS